MKEYVILLLISMALIGGFFNFIDIMIAGNSKKKNKRK